MVWKKRTLNDGRKLPEIGWGSWKVDKNTTTEQVEQAIETGFSHIDTAQVYGNEVEVGRGIKESALARKDIWLTTKWSGVNGKSPQESIHDSLDNLGVKELDLYLIHHPRLTNGDPAASWRIFESLKKEGLTKSIGVSNFEISDLEVLKNAGLSTPAVNQILLHPYVWERQKDLVNYLNEHGITIEAYSSLYPLTTETGGPLDPVLKKISDSHGITFAAVLFAWARSKGAVIVTTSRSKERLKDYLSAGDVTLTEEEIKDIDEAGAKLGKSRLLKRAAGLTLVGAVVAGLRWWIS
ncbi:Aldo/keto reductase [Meredithblackwellia eburnea MCA 4105]